MLLSEAIEALAVATLADGRSQRTVTEYRRKLAALLAFLGDVDIASITVHNLRGFVVELRGRPSRYATHPSRPEEAGGMHDATLAGYVRSVKRLFNFLEAEGIITANPARRIKKIRPARGEPKGITPQDLRRLLNVCAGEEVHDRRNRALLLLLADSGMRVGGLVGLRVGDVDIEAGQAIITEKGRKARPAFFSEVTAAALGAWLAVRPPGSDWVWPNLNNPTRAMTPTGVGELLRRLKARAGAVGPCNPHAFRHGFARAWIQAGGDIGQLADVLGHADVTTTWQSYAIFRREELAAKHSELSPIAKMGREGEL
jgi:site-specific recombinase XerD